jgi:uncharacterized protein (DUF2336 family)
MLSDDATALEFVGIDEVLMRGGADARKELARQLAAFVALNPTRSTDRSLAFESLVKLANDPVREVRHAVAEHLCNVAPLESDLVFTIIADEDEIALPFVANSRALDPLKMLAVLKVGDVTRQMEIAGRGELFRECIDQILEHAEWPVAAALLDNPCFEPSATDYRTLYRRFWEEPEIVERLLCRADVPLDIRILEAKCASRRMQSYLDATGYMESDSSEFLSDAEECATLKVLAEAYDSELDSAIQFLLNRKMLTPSLVLRTAIVGEMRVVERALALLSRIPLKRIRGLIYQRGVHLPRTILHKCGLPPACMPIIQAGIEVERECREKGESLSSDAFGNRVIEVLVTRFDKLSIDEKLTLFSHIEKFGTERPRAMAQRLKDSLGRRNEIAA